jgi:hypothetical protein
LRGLTISVQVLPVTTSHRWGEAGDWKDLPKDPPPPRVCDAFSRVRASPQISEIVRVLFVNSRTSDLSG